MVGLTFGDFARLFFAANSLFVAAVPPFNSSAAAASVAVSVIFKGATSPEGGVPEADGAAVADAVVGAAVPVLVLVGGSMGGLVAVWDVEATLAGGLLEDSVGDTVSMLADWPEPLPEGEAPSVDVVVVLA